MNKEELIKLIETLEFEEVEEGWNKWIKKNIFNFIWMKGIGKFI